MAKTIKGAKRVTHVYNRIKDLKTVSHYMLQDDHPRPVVLTDLIKIVEDRPYYQVSGILYKLHLRDLARWFKASTNLKPVSKDSPFCTGKIKIKGEASIIITWFNEDHSQVLINVYPGYYPSNSEELDDLLGDHLYLFG